MKTLVIVNWQKKDADIIFKATVDELAGCGAEVFVIKEQSKNISEEYLKKITLKNENEAYKICDIVIVIGGDGTIIHTAKKVAKIGKAVLGINAGRVGYLAGIEKDEIHLLKNLFNNNFYVEERMLLSVSVNKNEEHLCLNDAVISRGKLSRMVDILAYVEGGELKYRADGLIIATPTGSTAYSLSSGGPVVDPDLQSIIINPICPQSLFSRPVVLESNKEIEIKAEAPEGTDIYLTVDGEEACPVYKDTIIKIKKSDLYSVRLIKTNKNMFYNALAEKLKY